MFKFFNRFKREGEVVSLSEPLNTHDPLNSMCDCADCNIKNAHRWTYPEVKGQPHRPLSAYRQHLSGDGVALDPDERIRVIGSTHRIETGDHLYDADGNEVEVWEVRERGLCIVTPLYLGRGVAYYRMPYLQAVIGRARWLQAQNAPKYDPDYDYDPDNRLGA